MSFTRTKGKRSRIPGYVVRDNQTGDFIGCQCPISKEQFFGDDAERRQYEHTKALFDVIPGAYEGLPIPDIARIWRETQ
jgi:hypothetical protein